MFTIFKAWWFFLLLITLSAPKNKREDRIKAQTLL